MWELLYADVHLGPPHDLPLVLVVRPQLQELRRVQVQAPQGHPRAGNEAPGGTAQEGPASFPVQIPSAIPSLVKESSPWMLFIQVKIVIVEVG